MQKKDLKRYNPRGEPRPMDGRGRGVGMAGGQRMGRYDAPCPFGGAGYGRGGGRGKGRGRSVTGR